MPIKLSQFDPDTLESGDIFYVARPGQTSPREEIKVTREALRDYIQQALNNAKIEISNNALSEILKVHNNQISSSFNAGVSVRIGDETADIYLKLQQSGEGSGHNSRIRHKDNTSSDLIIQNDNDSGDVILQTNGSSPKQLKLDSAGNLTLVGVSVPNIEQTTSEAIKYAIVLG